MFSYNVDLKVAFYTLGCKLNFAESSIIGSTLQSKGFERVDFDQFADIYIINTCSVTESADKKCRKAIRNALSKSPNAFIVVTGCYAQLQPKEIATIPGVDLVLGADKKFNLDEYLNDISKRKNSEIHSCDIESIDYFFPAFSTYERTRAFLKIQDGCDYNCSYCTIPMARGKSRSPKIKKTIFEFESLINKGAREIVLTGVNIGDFGSNSNETFFDLLKELDKIGGARIRISSLEPNLLTDEIIYFISESNSIVPHLHLPLQSGSDSILKRMRRRYSSDYYFSRIEKLNNLIPDISIGVDIIVGFPEESDDEFNQTHTLLSNAKVSYFHVFNYSERPSTDAIKFKNKIKPKIRQNRGKELRHLSELKKKIFYESFIGKTRSVLFERSRKGNLEGFSDNYIRVSTPGSSDLVGTIQNVRMEMVGSGLVYGVIAN
ncbi:MAG: tRNA (N(6)-L-threonylcarbamoyladenosine(37)-C(2))-methylthiotransferase MtaB [Candidatus Marinimicrobia bacterium]|nr:tRNA (N(6)-L-threonylcarbamoyladenosine(37)-C(2))-methylthiotransferase MtaB [Candidatus Neomarinimicrobiota bacterium]